MLTLDQAAKRACPMAFEVAIKNCIQKPARGEKKRRVKISEVDSQTLYRFYRKHVRDDHEEALKQIALASRRAASGGALMSVAVFAIFLALVMALIFKSAWAPLFSLTLCALGWYLYWIRRRTAQKIWASRKAFKRGTEEALEKMCLILASSPLRTANLALVGGALALGGVFLWKMISVL